MYFLRLYISSVSGQTYTDTDFLIQNYSFNETLHNDLKHTDATAQVNIIPTVGMLNLIRQHADEWIKAQIVDKDDSTTTPIFTGYVRKSFTINKKMRLQPMSIELTAETYRLKKIKFSSSDYKNYQLTNTNAYDVIKTILGYASIDESRILIDSTTKTLLQNKAITYFGPDSAQTVADILDELCFEIGYVYDFDASGNLIMHALFEVPSTVSKQFSVDNINDQVQIQKSEQEVGGVRITYTPIQRRTNALLFEDTSGQTTAYKCVQPVYKGKYFGQDEDATGTNTGDYTVDKDSKFYAEYQNTEGTVKYVPTATLTLEMESGLDKNLESNTYYDGSPAMELSIYNSGSETKNVHKLDIYGDAYIAIDKLSTTSVHTYNTNCESKEFEFKYILDTASIDSICAKLSDYYRYSTYKITLKSLDNFNVGDYVILHDYGIGTMRCRIIEKKTSLFASGIFQPYSYTLYTVDEYTPASADEVANHKVIGSNSAGKATADGRDIVAPVDVSLVSATTNDSGEITVVFNQTTDNISVTYYNIWRRYNSGSWVKVSQIPFTKTYESYTYTDDVPYKGTGLYYEYTVTAVDFANNESNKTVPLKVLSVVKKSPAVPVVISKMAYYNKMVFTVKVQKSADARMDVQSLKIFMNKDNAETLIGTLEGTFGSDIIVDASDSSLQYRNFTGTVKASYDGDTYLNNTFTVRANTAFADCYSETSCTFTSSEMLTFDVSEGYMNSGLNNWGYGNYLSTASGVAYKDYMEVHLRFYGDNKKTDLTKFKWYINDNYNLLYHNSGQSLFVGKEYVQNLATDYNTFDSNHIGYLELNYTIPYATGKYLEKSDFAKHGTDYYTPITYSSRRLDVTENPRTSSINIDTSNYATWTPDKPVVMGNAHQDYIDFYFDETSDQCYGNLSYKLLLDGTEIPVKTDALMAAGSSCCEWINRGYVKYYFGDNLYRNAEILKTHKFIVRVANEAHTVESDSASINTSDYKGYDFPTITLGGQSSNRAVNLYWTDVTKTYGFNHYEIQIALAGHDGAYVSDFSTLKWYAPTMNKDPTLSEDNYYEGNENDTFSYENTAQTFHVPYYGQNDDSIGSKTTLYAFRCRAIGRIEAANGTFTTMTGDWSNRALFYCTPVTAYDVVSAWNLKDTGEKVKLNGALGAKQIFVEELSAISANLGYISSGGLQQSDYNYWYLSDMTIGSKTYKEGTFRVGGATNYILCQPLFDTDGKATGDYDLEIHMNNTVMTADGKIEMHGESFTIYNDAGGVLFRGYNETLEGRVKNYTDDTDQEILSRTDLAGTDTINLFGESCKLDFAYEKFIEETTLPERIDATFVNSTTEKSHTNFYESASWIKNSFINNADVIPLLRYNDTAYYDPHNYIVDAATYPVQAKNAQLLSGIHYIKLSSTLYGTENSQVIQIDSGNLPYESLETLTGIQNISDVKIIGIHGGYVFIQINKSSVYRITKKSTVNFTDSFDYFALNDTTDGTASIYDCIKIFDVNNEKGTYFFQGNNAYSLYSVRSTNNAESHLEYLCSENVYSDAPVLSESKIEIHNAITTTSGENVYSNDSYPNWTSDLDFTCDQNGYIDADYDMELAYTYTSEQNFIHPVIFDGFTPLLMDKTKWISGEYSGTTYPAYEDMLNPQDLTKISAIWNIFNDKHFGKGTNSAHLKGHAKICLMISNGSDYILNDSAITMLNNLGYKITIANISGIDTRTKKATGNIKNVKVICPQNLKMSSASYMRDAETLFENWKKSSNNDSDSATETTEYPLTFTQTWSGSYNDLNVKIFEPTAEQRLSIINEKSSLRNSISTVTTWGTNQDAVMFLATGLLSNTLPVYTNTKYDTLGYSAWKFGYNTISPSYQSILRGYYYSLINDRDGNYRVLELNSNSIPERSSTLFIYGLYNFNNLIYPCSDFTGYNGNGAIKMTKQNATKFMYPIQYYSLNIWAWVYEFLQSSFYYRITFTASSIHENDDTLMGVGAGFVSITTDVNTGFKTYYLSDGSQMTFNERGYLITTDGSNVGAQGPQGEKGERGEKGSTGAQGPRGYSIANVSETFGNAKNTLTFTMDDGKTFTMDITNGRGVVSATSTNYKGNGKANTITMKYTDDSTSTATVYNGNGIDSIETETLLGNGAANKITFKLSDGTESIFTVHNGTGVKANLLTNSTKYLGNYQDGVESFTYDNYENTAKFYNAEAHYDTTFPDVSTDYFAQSTSTSAANLWEYNAAQLKYIKASYYYRNFEMSYVGSGLTAYKSSYYTTLNKIKDMGIIKITNPTDSKYTISFVTKKDNDLSSCTLAFMDSAKNYNASKDNFPQDNGIAFSLSSLGYIFKRTLNNPINVAANQYYFMDTTFTYPITEYNTTDDTGNYRYADFTYNNVEYRRHIFTVPESYVRIYNGVYVKLDENETSNGVFISELKMEEGSQFTGFTPSSIKGDKGDTGTGVLSIEQTQTSIESSGTNIITAKLSDGTVSNFNILNGAKGDKGEKGDTGATGAKGDTGNGISSISSSDDTSISGKHNVSISMTDGTTSTYSVYDGPKGSTGDKGDKGDNGKSAYDIAVEKGYMGTETEWIASLKGATGDKGDTGSSGVSVSSIVQTATSMESGGTNTITATLSNGTTSTFNILNGSKGDKGDTGAAGAKGDTGAQGIQGEKGDKGDKGDAGATGEKGASGNGITSIVQTATSTESGGENVLTVSLDNGDTSKFSVYNGKVEVQQIEDCTFDIDSTGHLIMTYGTKAPDFILDDKGHLVYNY